MNTLEVINYWASVYAAVSCVAFVIAYTTLARWWKTAVGRLIMMLIGGLAGLSILSLVFYAYKDLDLVRGIRSVLVTVVGTSIWWQTYVLIRVQRRNDK